MAALAILHALECSTLVLMSDTGRLPSILLGLYTCVDAKLRSLQKHATLHASDAGLGDLLIYAAAVTPDCSNLTVGLENAKSNVSRKYRVFGEPHLCCPARLFYCMQ